MQKRLYKIEEGKVIAGVCGGVAEYLDVDPTVVRVIWALIGLSGGGILAYVICAAVMSAKSSV